MFSEKGADFRGFSDYPIFLSSVQQKTFIEVNEKGTEAAAITSKSLLANTNNCVLIVRYIFLRLEVVGAKGCARRRSPPKLEVFDANHPFLFYLIHSQDENHSVLFNGRVCVPEQPTKAKKD